MSGLQDEEEQEEGNEQLAGALCALAERLLGNTEQLDTVAPECEQLLERAQKIFPDSPEPLQVLFFICTASTLQAFLLMGCTKILTLSLGSNINSLCKCIHLLQSVPCQCGLECACSQGHTALLSCADMILQVAGRLQRLLAHKFAVNAGHGQFESGATQTRGGSAAPAHLHAQMVPILTEDAGRLRCRPSGQ